MTGLSPPHTILKAPKNIKPKKLWQRKNNERSIFFKSKNTFYYSDILGPPTRSPSTVISNAHSVMSTSMSVQVAAAISTYTSLPKPAKIVRKLQHSWKRNQNPCSVFLAPENRQNIMFLESRPLLQFMQTTSNQLNCLVRTSRLRICRNSRKYNMNMSQHRYRPTTMGLCSTSHRVANMW